MKVFFDFDGTLIDSRERLYRLFQFLVKSSRFSFDEYWELKRNKIDHKKILADYFFYSQEEILNFEREWFEKIELKEWLAFDKPFEGVQEFLLSYRQSYSIYLVTSRQSIDSVNFQLQDFGLYNAFNKIFIANRADEKAALIKKNVTVDKNDWIVGDNGKDIECGKLLGIKSAAVLSGFSNRQILEKFNPTIILNSVLDFSFDFNKYEIKNEFAL